jgi:hypothetical protein
MEYFKHFTNANENTVIIEAMNRFGHLGYAAWFILLEMCAEKMTKNQNETYTNVHIKFSFSERLVRQKLRISRTKVEEILNFFQTFSLLSWERVDNELKIELPKLLESLDRDQRRARQARDNAAPRARLEYKNKEYKNKESKKEEKRTLRNDDSVKTESNEDVKLLIAHYCDAWKTKYKTNVSMSGKWVGNAKTLIRDHGLKKSTYLINAFMQMNDSWFIKKRHAFDLILTNLAEINHFAGTGISVTNAQLNQLDKTQSNKKAAEEAGEYFMKGTKNEF